MNRTVSPRPAVVGVPDPGEMKKCRSAAASRLQLAVSEDCGKVKAVHGLVNYAPIDTIRFVRTNELRRMVHDLHVPYCFFHDASLEIPGMDLFDISRIFPIFSADADDPANYRFAETDAYLSQVIGDGVKVIFRFGESIEIGVKFRTTPPADYEKWANICINIVRHYNEGWADGFKWDIRDWAVWEEPNNPNLWGGSFDEYLKLYATIARRFKARFPQLRIGGPNTTTLGTKFLAQFLDFCRVEKLPLDFVNYTAYYLTPSEFLAESRIRRRMLDERGFSDLPLCVYEWHPSPVWDCMNDPAGSRRETARIGGVDGAAFSAALLCGLQDAPIERACFYSAVSPVYGIFDHDHRPTPIYYVFEKFNRLFDRSLRRVKLDIAEAYPDFQALASEYEDGIELLIGACGYLRHEIRIGIPPGFEVAAAEILDEEHPLFTAVETYRCSIEAGVLSLAKMECPAAFHVELRRTLTQ